MPAFAGMTVVPFPMGRQRTFRYSHGATVPTKPNGFSGVDMSIAALRIRGSTLSTTFG